MITYIHIWGLPVGQLTKQNQHDFADHIKSGFGKHTSRTPIENSHFRPNVLTTFTYDEDGNVTGVANVATHWLFCGDYTGEGWQTDDEARESISEFAAIALDVPPNIFNNPNINVEMLNQDETLQMLANNKILWGENGS